MRGSDCRACGDPAVEASVQPLPMEAILSGPASDGELARGRGGPASADGSAAARGTPGAGHPAAARGTPGAGHPAAARGTPDAGHPAAARGTPGAGHPAAARGTPGAGHPAAARGARQPAAARGAPGAGHPAAARGAPGAGHPAAARGTPGAGHPAAARGTPGAGHPAAARGARQPAAARGTPGAVTPNARAPSGPGGPVEHRARMSPEPGAFSTQPVVDGTPTHPRSGGAHGSWGAGEPSTAVPSSAGASSSAETLGSSTQCPACRSSVGAAQVFCDACGFRVRTRRKRAEQPDRIRCLECGHREPSTRASCGNCGMRFRR
jgi:hypothetical protein